jgi:prevent-host-death family protein
MKIVTVEELHAATERYVDEAAQAPVLITKQGQPVAVLRKAQALDRVGKPLPNREAWIARLPRTDLDSTQVVSEDRDRA